jgi:hypothetical protein
MKHFLKSVSTAITSCKVYAISIFSMYCLSGLTGIIMSQSGNRFALSQRDAIVQEAMAHDKASLNYAAGENFTAAMYDFTGNLFLSAAPQTIAGLTIVLPYLSATYQGWVGGIVSIDASHHSRFKDFKSTAYYSIVLLLNFLAYSFSIGAGIKCGIESYKKNSAIGWKIWKYRIEKRSLIAVGLVYSVTVPLFFLSSCFEFFSAWNG